MLQNSINYYLWSYIIKLARNNSYTGIAPVEENSTIEVFLGQNFRSDVCESEVAPNWRINDTDLIDTAVIQSFYAQVERGYDDATGNHQATLILDEVNSTLNATVVSCSARSTQILTYMLVVGKYTYV